MEFQYTREVYAPVEPDTSIGSGRPDRAWIRGGRTRRGRDRHLSAPGVQPAGRPAIDDIERLFYRRPKAQARRSDDDPGEHSWLATQADRPGRRSRHPPGRAKSVP